MTMKGREVILGILQESPHTGYEINDILQTRLSHFFDATFGMIYPTLKKLEAEKLVTKQQISQTDRPNKNIYTITAAGQAVFSKAINEPTSDEILKSDFLMHLYFSQDLSTEQVALFFQEEIARKEAKIAALQSQLATWLENGMTEQRKITFDYGIAYYTATLAVLKKAAKSNQ
ncbi:PadR family transcriptional regulator [Leuconostoc sp. MS02]|uniref:PadR family transcriptional regulator n=1 Tax=Leuconostoc aquikimchii TaxID=3236804 RepID=A0ABV3S573_9LACO